MVYTETNKFQTHQIKKNPMSLLLDLHNNNNTTQDIESENDYGSDKDIVETQSQTQINIMEQREIIYKQKESIELQKDEIMDQAVQIAEQHKQIMALLASSGDNDNGCDNRTDNDDYDDFYNRG